MVILKTVVHLPTGEFKNARGLFECGPFEPQRPILSVTNDVTTYDPDYDVVVVSRIPDPRTEKYDGTPEPAAKSQQEIDAYDLTQPKRIDGREVMRRLSGATQRKLGVLATQDDDVCKLWNTLRAGGDVDVHSVEFLQGAEKLKAVGIPAVWPDEAAFEAEKARLMA